MKREPYLVTTTDHRRFCVQAFSDGGASTSLIEDLDPEWKADRTREPIVKTATVKPMLKSK